MLDSHDYCIYAPVDWNGSEDYCKSNGIQYTGQHFLSYGMIEADAIDVTIARANSYILATEVVSQEA